MNPKIEIKTISQLFQKQLKIPNYQRPYKWKEKNVVQLLKDIKQSIDTNKATYRIGTAILYSDKDEPKLKNIVDGQQRIVTLGLILHYLKNSTCILSESFPNITSKVNIKANFNIISNWFVGWDESEKLQYKQYILDKCDIVCIELYELSEAFQLFDSQNARGKALEPYDLLKAFHLREMKENSESERLACVLQWEKSIDNGTLNILGKYVYRIRKWAKGEGAEIFTKDDIDEFKGINIQVHKNYPYLKSFILNDALPSHLYPTPETSFPFQITQLIINGKRFFEFVTRYTDMYDKLFNNENSTFHKFYKSNCFYDGAYRTGDGYVREIYEASLIYYSDKFGEVDFEKANLILYKCSYYLRLRLPIVRYPSINKYINRDGSNVFRIINDSYHPHEILQLKTKRPDEIKRPIEQVENIFNQ